MPIRVADESQNACIGTDQVSLGKRFHVVVDGSGFIVQLREAHHVENADNRIISEVWPQYRQEVKALIIIAIKNFGNRLVGPTSLEVLACGGNEFDRQALLKTR